MTDTETIPDKFYKHLKANKISIESVANEMLVSRQHLRYVLKNIRPLTDTMHIKLNTYLDTNFKEADTPPNSVDD